MSQPQREPDAAGRRPSGRLSATQAHRGSALLGFAAVMLAAFALLRFANGDGGLVALVGGGLL
jgi:hypothetical protein